MFENFLTRLKFDWWEITHCGAVGYFNYAIDWCKFILGMKKFKPDFKSYSEIDMDMDFPDEE
jgi:hypothetical protein